MSKLVPAILHPPEVFLSIFDDLLQSILCFCLQLPVSQYTSHTQLLSELFEDDQMDNCFFQVLVWTILRSLHGPAFMVFRIPTCVNDISKKLHNLPYWVPNSGLDNLHTYLASTCHNPKSPLQHQSEQGFQTLLRHCLDQTTLQFS